MKMSPKLLSAKAVRAMDERERVRTLTELREQLMLLRSSQTGGGVSDNPARSKQLKKQIARILTVMNEEKNLEY